MPSYTWKATYKDGTLVPQFTVDGEERSYINHLDWDKIESFSLFDGEKPILTLHLEEGQRLIYRRRVELSPGIGNTGVCHLLGWQKNVNGENIQSIAYVFEDGRIELAGRFRKDHPWFYAPTIIDKEASMGITYTNE
jgi:hypothetical protein